MTSLQKWVLVEARRALHNRHAHLERERRLRKSYGPRWIEPPWCAKCDNTARRIIQAAALCQAAFRTNPT